MQYINAEITQSNRFYGNTNPYELIEQYGSPLYVYNEKIFRQRCREMKTFIPYPKISVNYSVKANNNLQLLKIAREEGLNVDAMSPGEIYFELEAGFKPEQILFICNNVSKEEMQFAIDRNITISVDSLSQLEQFGQINPGGSIAIRFNPGVGAGHSQKVITAGKGTKFGVDTSFLPEVKEILKKYHLKLVGINQHIGSLFLEGSAYLEAVKSLLSVASQFENLEFVDFGGGFGIPYKKQENQDRLDLSKLGEEIAAILHDWTASYGKKITFKIEPGRYISAEAGVLLGTVHAVKINHQDKYIGTDLGFNVLIRPVMYDSHHDIEIYRNNDTPSSRKEIVTIVGNICETGDYIAKERLLPEIFEGDIIGVLDAGAYGIVMSSNYNNRLRPAEVLIKENGDPMLVRRRDTFEDLIRFYK
ncbi:MAG TPA: diaminopimelate decarboxylase [Acetivibrio sp.]|nr:diaminopimelate decarboxylase [Acetivibrio sp.]HPT77233.1 diaminopimelate decarboxylase [Defluviitaleaceae bacterium]